MRFEHLIQINDPLMPLLDPLSRAQLWQGLVRRAEEPTLFVLGLEAATIHARRHRTEFDELERTLDFGNFQVRDRVHLRPMRGTQTHVAASTGFPASRMTIEIEEPQPELLFLRFVYEFDDAAGGAAATRPPDDDTTDTLRREAYRSADLDTVARIRDLALAGELG
ncbi:MAG TPA: AtaL-like protein [Burkholderiaceae bacterium]|nr:AtaL-like protein [Burkholderiaceae bacterium]